MLAKRVIPCLDVNGGRVVKGTNFVNLRDAGDPVEVARRYEREGADELVFLDITASHEKRDTIVDVVRATADVVFMPLTVGGGIRTVDDFRKILNAGADKVSINSSAVKTPDLINAAAERFGSQCVVVNIDPKRVVKNGYDLPILKAVCDSVRIPVVASGGAGKPEHFVEAITEANASAVLAASVFHYGLYSIAEVKQAMKNAGIPVRI